VAGKLRRNAAGPDKGTRNDWAAWLRAMTALSNINIWRAARLVIWQHGDAAEIEARRMAEQMLDRGDWDGQAVWLGITRAIGELQAHESGEC